MLTNTDRVIESTEEWEQLRHRKDVKKVSMLGVAVNNRTRHEVIFNDHTSIFVLV